jgi:predicted metal-dependent TIM-barrel fold hydrolase
VEEYFFLCFSFQLKTPTIMAENRQDCFDRIVAACKKAGDTGKKTNVCVVIHPGDTPEEVINDLLELASEHGAGDVPEPFTYSPDELIAGDGD